MIEKIPRLFFKAALPCVLRLSWKTPVGTSGLEWAGKRGARTAKRGEKVENAASQGRARRRR